MSNPEYLNAYPDVPLIPEEFLDREVAIYSRGRNQLLELSCKRDTVSHFLGLLRSRVAWPRHLEFSLKTEWAIGWKPIVLARVEEGIEGLREAVIEVATVGTREGVGIVTYRIDDERQISLSQSSREWQVLRREEVIPLRELPESIDFKETIGGFLGLFQEMSALEERGGLPEYFPRPQFVAAQLVEK